MALPNDPNAITKGTMFPAELVPEFLNKVRGHSSLAKMSGAKPTPFNGNTLFTFAMDNEVDIVAEAGAKSAGGASVGTKTVTPIKIEYGARVSDEFLWASEEMRMSILETFAEGWSKKVARGLDIMAMHGVNPRTGLAASTLIGTNNFDSAVTNSVTYLANSSTADANIEAAIALVQGGEYDVSGAILGNTIKGALAAMTGSDGHRLYPDLAWGNNPSAINGLPVDANSTVEFNSALARAYVGDFANLFRWGIAKELPIEVIRYGNPDNDATAGDLAGHNQVYLRGEAFVGWAIMDPAGFAKVVASA